jgi:flagellar motor switch protein FliN/FliY
MLNDKAVADEWEAAMAEQAGAAPGGATATATAPPPAASAAAAVARPAPIFNPLTSAGSAGAPGDIDLIMDIPVQLTVELGRTRIPIRHILQLAQGSVVELEGLAGEPMDVLVNGCLIAQGEVVVVNDKFGIRLTDIVTPAERMRKIGR